MIEVRAPSGRFVDRRVWDAGATVTLDAELRPAFAIVEVAGSSDPVAAAELATRVEAALGAARGLLIFAPTPGELEIAAQDRRLGTALSGGDATVMRRRDLVLGWTEHLNTQGVAWLAPVPGAIDVYSLFLLAKDSGQPDVIQLAMGEVGSRAAVEQRLGAPTPAIVRMAIQASVVDVGGVEGAAVIRVDAGGVGEAAGLRSADVIVGAAGTPVASAWTWRVCWLASSRVGSCRSISAPRTAPCAPRRSGSLSCRTPSRWPMEISSTTGFCWTCSRAPGAPKATSCGRVTA